jgi:hypothetical protein
MEIRLGRATADNAAAVLLPYSKVEREYRDSLTITEAHNALAEKIIAFVRSDDFAGDSEYVSNLKAIFAGESVTVKNFGFAASAIAAYKRFLGDVAKREAKAAAVPSTHVGDVGGKITATCTVVKHLELDGQYGVTHLYNFITEAGSCLSWFASRDQDLTEGDVITITGTVKGHGEFRGSAQTTLTRCKVA